MGMFQRLCICPQTPMRVRTSNQKFLMSDFHLQAKKINDNFSFLKMRRKHSEVTDTYIAPLNFVDLKKGSLFSFYSQRGEKEITDSGG